MTGQRAQVTRLVVNSEPVSFDTATLRRSQETLPTGLLGSEEWQVDIKPTLSDIAEDARVELTADGIDYSGAARVAGPEAASGATSLVGTGPLISYDQAGR